MIKWLLIFILIFSQQALAFDLNFADSLGNLGTLIDDLLSNEWFVFGLTFILLYMIFFSIFMAALSRVDVFKGSNGRPNRPGRIISGSLGLMVSMGIAYWANFNSYEFVRRVLEPIGWFGAIAMGVLMFGVAYYNMGKNKGSASVVLFAIALGIFTYGSFIGDKGMKDLGMGLAVASLIWMIIAATTGGGNGSTISNTISNGVNNFANTFSKVSRPSYFQATPAPNGVVNISWQANPSLQNITHYELEKVKPSSTFLGNQTGLKFKDTTTEGGKHEYRIRAVANDGKKSGWTTVKLDLSCILGGTVAFYDFEDHPIDRINVTISAGNGQSVTVSTHTNGQFATSQLPSNAGNISIKLTDPLNVYQTKLYPNIDNINNTASKNIQTSLLMDPLPTPSNVDLIIKLTSGGNPIISATFIVLAATRGLSIKETLSTDSNGNITMKVPAGYFVIPFVTDPINAYKNGYDSKGGVLLRDPSQKYNLTLDLQTNTGGRTVIGQTYYNGTGTTPKIGMPGVAVTIGDGSAANSDGNGDYSVESITPTLNATVTAKDPTGQYESYPDPYIKNYAVILPTQTLPIQMIPTSPPRGTIKSVDKTTGKIIITYFTR